MNPPIRFSPSFPPSRSYYLRLGGETDPTRTPQLKQLKILRHVALRPEIACGNIHYATCNTLAVIQTLIIGNVNEAIVGKGKVPRCIKVVRASDGAWRGPLGRQGRQRALEHIAGKDIGNVEPVSVDGKSNGSVSLARRLESNMVK